MDLKLETQSTASTSEGLSKSQSKRLRQKEAKSRAILGELVEKDSTVASATVDGGGGVASSSTSKAGVETADVGVQCEFNMFARCLNARGRDSAMTFSRLALIALAARTQLASYKEERGIEYNSDDDIDLQYAQAALEALTPTNSEVDTGLNEGYESTSDDGTVENAIIRNLNTLKTKERKEFHVGD